MVNNTTDTTILSDYSEIPPSNTYPPVDPEFLLTPFANITINAPDVDRINIPFNEFDIGLDTITIGNTINTSLNIGLTEPASERSTSWGTTLFAGTIGSIGDINPGLSTITIQPSGRLDWHGLILSGDTTVTPRTKTFLMSKGATSVTQQDSGVITITAQSGFSISEPEVKQFLQEKTTQDSQSTTCAFHNPTCKP